MPAYRYVLCDLLTDRLVAQLPLSGVSFDRRISRTGSLQAQLNATTPQLIGAGKLLFAFAGRAALYAYRDNELWWGGIPWTVTPKQGQRGGVTLDLQAATFDSYAWHRELYADRTYSQVDQGVIIPDLWRTIQAAAPTDANGTSWAGAGNIGVVAADQPTGVLRDRTYLVADKAKVGQLVEDLGDVIDGPEHTIDVYADDQGNRVKRLRIGTPKLGLTEPRTVFQRAVRGGGRLLEWSHTADAVDSGTVFQTRGDAPDGGGEDPTLSDRLVASELLASGWPLLDASEDRPGTTELDTLNGWAAAMRQQYAGQVKTSTYTVQVGTTGWSPNRLGDPVRIKLADAWHDQPEDADLTVRPVGVKVTAADRGTPETVDLLFGDD